MARTSRGILFVILALSVSLSVASLESPPMNAESTPLHWAAEHGISSLVARLIDNGALVDAPDAFGRTPLHLAVRYADVVGLLLDAGAQVDPLDVFGRTPLHDALQYPQTVQLLLENGASVEIHDHLGDTPLDRTLRFGTRSRNLVVINLLLDYGAGAPNKSR